MKDTFKVGAKYRNRHGEYEVVNLDGPNMVIRYADGSVIESTVELQARIWRNIQIEEAKESVKPKEKKPRLGSHRRNQGGHRGFEFQGLRDDDFQRGVGGTSWRARTGLGGMLAQRMSDTTPYFFQSYAIYRRAEVHISQPDYYDTKRKWRQAKFVLNLDSICARYGFYIEKNNGPMDATWNWPTLLACLESDLDLQQRTNAEMKQLELRWEVYFWPEFGLTAKIRSSTDGLIWEWQDRNELETISWLGFAERLRNIEIEQWCDLYLCTDMGKGEAIDGGFHVVDKVTEIYRALLPLYEASTRSNRRYL